MFLYIQCASVYNPVVLSIDIQVLSLAFLDSKVPDRTGQDSELVQYYTDCIIIIYTVISIFRQ